MELYEYLRDKYKQRMLHKSIKDLETQMMTDRIQIDTKKWTFKREEIYER